MREFLLCLAALALWKAVQRPRRSPPRPRVARVSRLDLYWVNRLN